MAPAEQVLRGTARMCSFSLRSEGINSMGVAAELCSNPNYGRKLQLLDLAWNVQQLLWADDTVNEQQMTCIYPELHK